jgi:DNA-binding XRE family transcriptional regulator
MKRKTIAPYLRALRRKSTLAQEDIAFLLGAISGTRIGRHESGECEPPLNVALAYEVIFGRGVGTIYSDELLKIAKQICKRAQKLHESLGYRRNDRFRDKKQAVLEEIIRRHSSN